MFASVDFNVICKNKKYIPVNIKKYYIEVKVKENHF